MSEAKQFDVQYYSSATGKLLWSHSNTEEWGKLDIYCPKCAAKDVWHSMAPGDYYVDEQYLCASCGCTFYMPGGVRNGGGEHDLQRLEHLRKTSPSQHNE